MFAATPAFAQAWPNDVKLTQFTDITYTVSPDWRLNFFGELREDHNVGRFDNSIFRPIVQYEFVPHWRIGAGYVQFQSWQSPYNAERGPFQDLYYQDKFGDFVLLSRLRFNQTFGDTNPAVLVTSAFFEAITYQVPGSAWSATLSNEIYVALKTDGYPGFRTGFFENKAFVGMGYTVDSHMTLVGGYELDVLNRTPSTVAHNFKIGLIAGF